ncbi:MAG: choice-of-anchor I family protein [Nocardioides sp.]
MTLSSRRARAATALVAAAGLALSALALSGGAPAGAAVVDDPVSSSAPGAALRLDPLGSYDTGVFDESAAEIVEFYAPLDRLLVVNAAQARVEVLDAADPENPTKLFDLETTGVTSDDGSVIPDGAVANSVAVRKDGLGVVAVESDPKTDNGWLVFFDAAGDGTALGAVRVGALPDMVTVTPDGTKAVVADEGEPADDYSVDPEGSVAVVALPSTVAAAAQGDVALADFHAFEGGGLPPGIRVYGGRADAGTGTPDFPVSENLEPEYVTVDPTSRKAYVTVQEANGIAVVDLASAAVVNLWSLGSVDRRVVGFDPSDEDGAASIGRWPVRGLRLPDAIASYQVKGRTYLVTADEGDTRDWEGYSEEVRVKDLGEDGIAPLCDSVAESFGMTVEELTADEALGRLKVTKAGGLDPSGLCYRELHAFGGRDFSVWTTGGRLVSSSGSGFERIIAQALPDYFNSDHAASNFDDRSDDKGPEPEGVAIGQVTGKPYAFVALERVGGVMVYDLSSPSRPTFVTYLNNRDFAFSGADLADAGEDIAPAGDLGPEGVKFVPASSSPTGQPMVAVANEVSGSTTLYAVKVRKHHRGHRR